jgi:plasmid maintenance system antidote protein VapI|tara:strand:+ start:4653 stop:4841 length:189 start_codon:yes stop_codon:yes gene_type:complete
MKPLKQHMRECGFSQNQLARQIALDKSMLSLMMRGKRKFRYEHKVNIARVLGIKMEFIEWPF